MVILFPMTKIKEIREKLKMSQQELGEAVGVGQTAISNYEVGDRIPDVPVAIKLRDLAVKNKIKVSLEDLLVRTESRRSA